MKKRLLYSLFSGCLLGVAWPEIGGLFPIIFFALVPVLLVEDEVLTKRYRHGKVYVNAYVTFFFFNLITTWWIWNASPGGAIMAIFANSALMAIPFWMFHLTKRYIGKKEGYIGLIIYWLGFEWGHFRWELSWPWLSYGNVFANQTDLVQWYEYTGVLGGSLWVLIINLILFFLVKKAIKKTVEVKPKADESVGFYNSFKKKIQFLLIAFKTEIKLSLLLLSLIIFPIVLSLIIKSGVSLGSKEKTISVVISQPNIDPYRKFDGYMSAIDQVKHLLEICEPNLDQNTDLILAPETALPMSLAETNLEFSDEVMLIKEFLSKYPNASLLTGLSSHDFFKEPKSNASRLTSDGMGYYENYNSALLIDKNGKHSIYHKSELVLGVERLPLAFILKYIEEMFDFGGTTGTLGVEKEAKVFKKGKAIIAPTICYESVYGDYTGDFSEKGANIIAISTNDAWWFDTPGYKQLLAYAKLRAIENRKWIARSANTGISCFINPKGEITQKTKWEETASIKGDIPLISGQTFYVKYGDYIGRLSLFIGILLFLFTLAMKLKKR